MNAEPLPVVVGLGALVPARARVVELGAGDGRNSIYLARQGLDVDVFDASSAALDEVTARARSESLAIQPIVGDLAVCNPVLSSYEAVVCTHILHFLSPARALDLLTFLATSDRAPRVQALGVITRHGDFAPRYPDRYFVEPGELHTLYLRNRWNIVTASEEDRAMIARHPDGRNMRNVVSYLLVSR